MGALLYVPTILPPKYQSQQITLHERITLFTLCLAPLLANLLAGAPRVSVLTKKRPPWHENICLYNPTSILWRYAAIADRRIRAKEWLKVDVAAANAIFWTDDGWDGSEGMIVASLMHCSRLPDRTTAEAWSGETIKTIIVTLQGPQTAYLLVGSLVTNVDLNAAMSLDGIFSFLTIFGCLRLSPALWLTEHYQYIVRNDTRDSPELHNPPFISETKGAISNKTKGAIRPLILGIIDDILPGSRNVRDNYVHTFWASILCRAVYLLLIVGMWVLAFVRAFLNEDDYIYTATTYSVINFFLIFLTVSIPTFIWYFVRKGTRSTIISCISRTWYKLYTIALFLYMTFMVVIGAIETRQTVCGKFTSWHVDLEGDGWLCARPPTTLMDVAWGSTHEVFAVAANLTQDSGNFTVLKFVGDCIGQADYSSTRPATLST